MDCDGQLFRQHVTSRQGKPTKSSRAAKREASHRAEETATQSRYAPSVKHRKRRHPMSQRHPKRQVV